MNVILTGASRGIGKAIADELSRRSHSCYMLTKSTGCDISNYTVVAKAFADREGWELPDVLINNAGVVDLGGILEMDPEVWRHQFDVNVHGTFYCCKEFVNMVKYKKSDAKIINIASTAGLLVPRPGWAAYAASKAAVISLSLTLAEEVKAYGIKVYCIAPGACNTDLRRQIYPDDDFENMMQPGELAKFIVDVAESGDMLDNQVILARGI